MRYKTDSQLTVQLLELYAQQKSLDEMAEIVGYKRSVITRLLREAGAVIRRRGKVQKYFIVDGKKQCGGPCGQERPVTDFSLHSTTYDGLQGWCRECQNRSHRNYLLLRKFGITEDDYNAIWQSQNGVCAICGQPETRLKFGKPTMLAVDHNHKTKAIRELICFRCNVVLGKVKENPVLCDKIKAYILKHTIGGNQK